VELDPTRDRRWDRFVCERPGATVYHLSGWAEILGRTYRFRPSYLALEDARGRLRAVMPIAYKRGPLSGARMRSLPAVPFAGPLGANPALERELMAAACERLGEAQQLVVTTSTAGLDELPGVARRPGLPRWIVPLDGSTDPSRWRAGSRNPARGVRRSAAAGVRVREATSEADLRAFYRLYLRTQRRLRGLPRRYLQLAMARSLFASQGIFRLFLAEYHARPVAGAVWHVFGGQVEGLYYGGDERFLPARPNHALFAHVLEWALEHGQRALDLGGALPGSSLAYFKSQWGARPTPLYFYVYPARAAPADPKAPPAPSSVELAEIGWLERAWTRAPLALTRAAGAIAYRYL
jgi:Acetyltransferase (GNAT) domain